METSVLILAVNSSTQDLISSIRSFKSAGVSNIMMLDSARYGFVPVIDPSVKLFHSEDALAEALDGIDGWVYVTRKFEAPRDFLAVVGSGKRSPDSAYCFSGYKIVKKVQPNTSLYEVLQWDRNVGATRYEENDSGDIEVDCFSGTGFLVNSSVVSSMAHKREMSVFENPAKVSRALKSANVKLVCMDSPWKRNLKHSRNKSSMKMIPGSDFREPERQNKIVGMPYEKRVVEEIKPVDLSDKYDMTRGGTPFFGVVIPVYRSCRTLKRGLQSIAGQTFPSYKVYVCDDESGEPYATENGNSVSSIIGENGKFIRAGKKIYAGGCRDLCLDAAKADNVEYMLFLDADDHFEYKELFHELYSFITSNGYPDVIVLPSYQEPYSKDNLAESRICRSPSSYATQNGFVPPWAKCIRAKICPRFESGLRRSNDVLQHVRTVDTAKTVTSFPKIVVRRKKDGETTLHGNSRSRNIMCTGAVTGMLKCMVQLLEEPYKHEYARAQAFGIVSRTLRKVVPNLVEELGDNLKNLMTLIPEDETRNEPLVTAKFAGQLGNVMLSVYTCFWFAWKKGIPLEKVMFDKHYQFHGRINRSDDYIGDNFPIFENVKAHFLDGPEYESVVRGSNIEQVCPDGRKRLVESDVGGIGTSVEFEKYVWHFPQDDDDRKLFRILFNVEREKNRQLEKYENEFDPASSVALHVRRTDYAVYKDGAFMETAQDIIDKLDKHAGKTVVVFSDDIEWCRKNLHSDKCKLVFHEPQEHPYEDMVLMSLFGWIESNTASTYSYCAKLLDEHIVELPEKTFK